MKRILIIPLLLLFVLLSACTSDSLIDNEFSVFTINPTENLKEISSSNSNLIFKFDKDQNIIIESNGNEYLGTYKLNDKELSINIEGENDNNIDLTINDFEENSQNEHLYTGEISHIKLPEKHDLNTQLSNFSENEYLGFYEN